MPEVRRDTLLQNPREIALSSLFLSLATLLPVPVTA